MNMLNEILSDCENVLWCRWDFAIRNWLMLYAVTAFVVHMSWKNDVLFGNHTSSTVMLTALVVTLIVVITGLLSKIAKSKIQTSSSDENHE